MLQKLHRARYVFQGMTVKQFKNVLFSFIDIKFKRSCSLSYPQTIEIVPTRNCNLKCVFCKNYESEATYFPYDKFQEIADHFFPHARRLYIGNGGEPLLHKQTLHFFAEAKKHAMKTEMVTNGMLLTKEKVDEILSGSLLNQIYISIDGIKNETVESVRINAKLDKIKKNIAYLISERNKKGLEFPKVTIRYILMKSTIRELPEAVTYWESIGVDKLLCNYLSVCNDVDPDENLLHHPKLLKETLEKAKEAHRKSTTLQLEIKSNDTSRDSLYKDCIDPWKHLRIEPDGVVAPCCKSWGKMKLGNIFTTNLSLFHFWNNKAYQSLRKTVNDDTGKKFYEFCRHCPIRHGESLGANKDEETTWLESVGKKEDIKESIIKSRAR